MMAAFAAEMEQAWLDAYSPYGWSRRRFFRVIVNRPVIVKGRRECENDFERAC